MRLVEDWRVVLRHAWSIRLIVIAGVLSGVEAALPVKRAFAFWTWVALLKAPLPCSLAGMERERVKVRRSPAMRRVIWADSG